MRKVSALVLCALVSTGAELPPVLEHTGPWDVHSSENACMLARPFGTGDQSALVAFQPLFNSQSGELFVITPRQRGGNSKGEARIVHEPSGQVDTGRYFSVVLPKEGKRATRITVSRETWDELDRTDVLSITAPPIKIRIRLVRVAAAKAAFARCERATLADWGVDPIAIEPDHAPVPLQKPETFFQSADYPMEAIRRGHVGRVVAILNVDTNGAVTECRIGSSSWPDLGKATCTQARRVRFSPAHDAAGKPVVGLFLFPIRWSLRGD